MPVTLKRTILKQRNDNSTAAKLNIDYDLIAFILRALVHVDAGGHLREFAFQSAPDDGRSVEPEATQALDAALVTGEVFAGQIVHESVGDVGEVLALNFGARGHVARPRAVTLTQEDRIARADVARIALEADDAAVVQAFTVQHHRRGVGHFRQRIALNQPNSFINQSINNNNNNNNNNNKK